MLKVVVAEDELPLLRGLACLIERLNPNYQVVCKAKNGKEALEFLTQQDADVLFSDINMPVLNGLQLMEQAQQVNPHLMMVVVSGYCDFEYARQAMRFGVKNYLLKPINRGELQNLLAQMAQEAAQDMSRQKRSTLIEYLYCGNDAALQQYSWKPLTVVYLCLGSYQSTINADEVLKPGALADEEMWQCIHSRWGTTSFWLFLGGNPNEAVWIFEGGAPVSLLEIRELLKRRFQETLNVTAALQNCIEIADLLSRIEELHNWITRGVVLGESRLLREKPMIRDYPIQLSDRDALHQIIKNQQWDEFFLLIQRIVGHLNAQQITQLELENFLTKVLTLVMRECGTTLEREPREIVRELISGSQDFHSLFGSFFGYCKDMGQNVSLDIYDKQALMQSMDAYILKHIAEPLTLNKLSQKFGLVAPYLSKLFKAYKGMSPTQYIQEIRIESAKRMLRERPAMLAKEISGVLGYSNPQYFSKTFYKHVGMYPSEYRERNKQE